jgi:hypothetical protein
MPLVVSVLVLCGLFFYVDLRRRDPLVELLLILTVALAAWLQNANVSDTLKWFAAGLSALVGIGLVGLLLPLRERRKVSASAGPSQDRDPA